MVIQLGNKNSGFVLSRAYLYAYRLGILSAFILFLLSIHLLLPISIDTNVAEGVATPSTTTLAINTNYSSANLDFTTISSTGTFASSSAEDIAKFTVTTNNYTGYTLTLAGNDDTGQLNNISAGAALDSIATSGIESSSFSTNEWGYLPSKYNSEANTTKYYSAPTTSDADTLDVTNAANSTANEYTIGLGAKVDYSKPAGTYTNTFILAAVGNPVNYTINYLDNTADSTVANLPTPQSSSTTATTVTLAPNKTPTRTDYAFVGWCDVATTNKGTVCSGNTLQSGDTVEINQTTTNTISLYATWLSTKPQYLQSWGGCDNLSAGETVTLIDKRDEQEYTVAKLKDGRCWMDNLNLGAVDLVEDIDQTNTHLSEIKTIDKTTFRSSTWKKTRGSNTYTAPEYIPLTTNNTSDARDTDSVSGTKYGVLYNYCAASAQTICASSNSGNATSDLCPAGWRLPTGGSSGEFDTLYNNFYDTNVKMRNPISGDGAAFAFAGYNSNDVPSYQGTDGSYWASTRFSSMGMHRLYLNTANVYSTDGTNRYYGSSIRCIKMPYSTTITFDGNGATGGEMDDQVISGDSAPSGALASNGYTRTGYVFTGWNTAANGSGTSYADEATYTAASTSETSVTLYAQWAESGGYIQDYTKSTCQANASSAPVYLTDKRDNKVYRARYINGNCWMVDNLRFVGKTGDASGTMTLDSTTSNVASIYTTSSPQTISYSDLISGNSYDQARLHVSDNVSYGVYYNYPAASAMTVTGNDSSANATYDICPKGWRLPTRSEQSAISSTSGSTTYVSTWLPVYGGAYNNGSLNNELINGSWWSSTLYNNAYPYSVYYSSGKLYSGSGENRYTGIYMRCVAMSDVEISISQMTMQEIGKMNNVGYVTLLNSMENGRSYNVTDGRDGKSYTIAKVGDRLWMTSNLRFIGKTGDASGTMTLDSTTSNVASTYTTSNPLTIAYNDLTSGSDYTDARLHVSNNTSYGVYYNYSAATAKTITGDNNTTNATYDICPAGWRLPTNIEQKTIGDGSTNYVSTWLPIYGGYYKDSYLYNESSHGYWWASTSYNNENRYYMFYNSDRLYSNYLNIRNFGYYVRCIREIPSIQDYTKSSCQGEASSQAVMVADKRDGKEYRVRYVNGNCWMVDNLRFVGKTGDTFGVMTLDSTTSNVASTYTESSPQIILYDDLTSGNSYDEARLHVSDNTSYGVYYNYAAASAMTITGSNNTNTQTYDICPKGWRLPTSAEQGTIGTSSSTYVSTWLPVYGGVYYNGTLNNESTNGLWWSSTSYGGGSNRYNLYYYSGNLYSDRNSLRSSGFYVRCIRAS